MSVKFSEATLQEFHELATHYPVKRATLLPALWLAQKEFGYISHDVIEAVAELVEITPAQVEEVVSFYTMYLTEKPGRYHLQLCRTLSCWLRGSEEIAAMIEKKLNLRPGETTPDGFFSLQMVECLGSCHTSPVMQINEDYHENLTPETAEKIIDDLKGRP